MSSGGRLLVMILAGIFLASGIIVGVNAAEQHMIISPGTMSVTTSQIVTTTTTSVKTITSITTTFLSSQGSGELNSNLTELSRVILSSNLLTITLRNEGPDSITISILSVFGNSGSSSATSSGTIASANSSATSQEVTTGTTSSSIITNSSETNSSSSISGVVQGNSTSSANNDGSGLKSSGISILGQSSDTNVTGLTAIATFLVLENGTLFQSLPVSNSSTVSSGEIGLTIQPGHEARLTYSGKIQSSAGPIVSGQAFIIQVVEEPFGAIARFPVVATNST